MRRAAVISLGLLVGAGCASSVGTGGARVLQAGQQEAGIGLDLTFPSARVAPSNPTVGVWPQGSLGYRRGLGAGFEAGARVWGFGWPRYLFTVGGGLDLRYALLRAPNQDEGFDLTLGAGTAYHQINAGSAPTHVWVTQAPLLLGFNLGGGHQLFGGPRFEIQHIRATDVHPVNAAFVGLSLGIVVRAMRFLEIRPEVVALYSPVGFNGTQDPGGRRGLGIVQFGLSNAILLDEL